MSEDEQKHQTKYQLIRMEFADVVTIRWRVKMARQLGSTALPRLGVEQYRPILRASKVRNEGTTQNLAKNIPVSHFLLQKDISTLRCNGRPFIPLCKQQCGY